MLHLFRSDDTRGAGGRAVRLAFQAVHLALLPRAVRRFWLRALLQATRASDTWSVDVACRPAELHHLLRALRGRRVVVELGTAAAWTASALALAEPGRRVISWDVTAHPQREATLGLLPPGARARVDLRDRTREDAAGLPAVDAVFIDSSHEEEETAASFREWSARLVPGGVVAFHDWDDPAYPGVTRAVRRLGLRGVARGRLFVWTAPRA